MRKPIIAGNWKMHKTVSEAVELCEALDRSVQDLDIEVVVCPPFTALSAVCALNMGKVKIGAQNVSIADAGAYTGEISPLMLVDTCCSYVIIGHSERRQHFGKQTPWSTKDTSGIEARPAADCLYRRKLRISAGLGKPRLWLSARLKAAFADVARSRCRKL